MKRMAGHPYTYYDTVVGIRGPDRMIRNWSPGPTLPTDVCKFSLAASVGVHSHWGPQPPGHILHPAAPASLNRPSNPVRHGQRASGRSCARRFSVSLPPDACAHPGRLPGSLVPTPCCPTRVAPGPSCQKVTQISPPPSPKCIKSLVGPHMLCSSLRVLPSVLR
jgi:hypothetical protein